MKRQIQHRLLQHVAVALIGLIAMQPAIAGRLCAAPAAPCPLAITDTGPSCGMLSGHDIDAPRLIRFVRAIPRSNAAVALPASRKALALVTPDAPFEALPFEAAVVVVDARPAAQANSPPIYIRNRVFRI
jgi:hypothetical protein